MNIRLAGLFILSGIYSITTWAGGPGRALYLPDTQATGNGLSSPQVTRASTKSGTHDYTRSTAEYAIPDVVMADRSGRNVSLRKTIDYGGPVMVQFIFVSCSAVCPILSYSFSAAQSELDRISPDGYRLVSISIDPEEDRPEKLNEYASRFKAGSSWVFLTGNQGDVEKTLKAFDASYAANNKMSHKSLTFMRGNVGDKWTRLEGLLGKNSIIEEFKDMVSLSNQSKN